MKLQYVCVLVFFLGMAIISHASEALKMFRFCQTTTQVKRPLNPSIHTGLSCPVGYEVGSINSNIQDKIEGTVRHECNDPTPLGIVHVWCENPPLEYYFQVKNSPGTMYSCQKVENEWPNTIVTGSRG